MDYKQLKRAARNTDAEPVAKLALMGDCATQHIAMAVNGCSRLSDMPLEVFDAEYNQIGPQIIDQDSQLYAFEPDYLLMYMCTEKLYTDFCEVPLDQRQNFAQDVMKKIEELWDAFHARSSAQILQFSFAEYDDGVFGNFAAGTPGSFLFQLRRLNMLLMQRCADTKSAYIVDLAAAQNAMGRNSFYDAKYFYIAKMPVSLEALPIIAQRVVEVVRALRGGIRKCIVCDLDNTLWGGVIGDDGLSGIEIGELGVGRAFSDLQRWLLELKKRGILLAICSKNDEDKAKEPFEKHPDMILHLDDFVMFVANWEDKASNIRAIQQTLNIGMDSLVFLDDNPFERNLVKSMIPDITVPDLPDDPALYVGYLQSLDLFETVSYSCTDADRTGMYQAESKRVASQARFESYDDYLESLEMVAVARPFEEFYYPRIAQLTQRSNQFNLRTVRYTEQQIRDIAADGSRLTLYFTLRDRYSDHGLISVVVLEKRDTETIFIDTWVMSCRVLKRGMEEFIADKILQTAKDNGFKTVMGEYRETLKNSMVRELYPSLGFAPSSAEGVYTADVETFEMKKTHIREERQ